MTDPLVYVTLALSTIALLTAIHANEHARRILAIVITVVAGIGYAAVIAYLGVELFGVVLPTSLDQVAAAESAMSPGQRLQLELVTTLITGMFAAVILFMLFVAVPGKEKKK